MWLYIPKTTEAADDAFTHASFCAGYGGLSIALRLIFDGRGGGGVRDVLHVEREAYAASLLVRRMEEGAMDTALVWSDLGTFDSGRFSGCVDIVSAGLPCQPYSAAGARRGHDDERAIWPRFLDHVGAMRPAVVVLENVPPFLKYFQPVGERLSSMGYRYKTGIFSAEEVGASHLRERLFIVCYRADVLADPGRFGFERRRVAELVRGPAPAQLGEGHQRQWDGDAARDDGQTVADAGGGRRDARRRLERPADGLADVGGRGSALEDAGRRLAAGSADGPVHTSPSAGTHDQSARPSGVLADSVDGLVSESGRRAQGRTGPRPADSGMADAARDGCPSDGRMGEPGERAGGHAEPCGPNVADSEGGRPGAGSESRGDGGCAGESSEVMADAAGPERAELEYAGTGPASYRGEGMADTDSGRQREDDLDDRQSGGRDAEPHATGGGEAVAYAEGGSRAFRATGIDGLERLASSGGPFPPGPADGLGWIGTLAGRPDLIPAVDPRRIREVRGIAAPESALHDMADGLASAMDVRIDALRAAGNGVVALTAAVAIVELSRELGIELGPALAVN